MKKLLMILLGAMLVLSMAGSAVAAEGDPHTVRTSDSVETTVTLGLSELFEVTLPSLIELDYDEAHDSFVGKATFSIDIIRLAFVDEDKDKIADVIGMYKGEKAVEMPVSFTRGYFSNSGKNR